MNLNSTSMKLTTWNIENLKRPLSNPTNPINRDRLMAISNQIIQMDPDILCVLEAPGDVRMVQEWVDLPSANGGLDGLYNIALIPGTREILDSNPSNVRRSLQNLYAMQGNVATGDQWIWFLIKEPLYRETRAYVQDPGVWYGMTGRRSWPVNYWGRHDPSSASHWRHPQTLVLKFGRRTIEVIGVHMKSKVNLTSAFDANGNLTTAYVDEALRARVKLATEAYDVRMYIEHRFQQERNPHIIVCGDMNDGPGREFFERQYLFFDLISNIQGEVFFSSRYLNHALFDYDEHLRWTTQFNDRIERWALETQESYHSAPSKIDPTNQQLIDHIMFTQAFVDRYPGPKVLSQAGFVEHTIHEKINAMLTKSRQTSDHRPVSVEIAL
jgi:exonuclease III